MTPEPGLVFPPFRLDLAQHQLWRGTERVPLRPKAFAVLRYLVTHAPCLVTPAELLQAVWADAYVSEGLLRSYMRELRVVLGDEARTPQFIATVTRRGWRFLAPVTTTPHPAHPTGAVGAVHSCDPAAAPVPASLPEPMPHAASAMPEVPAIPRTRRVVSGEHKQVTVLVAGLKGVTTLAQAVETEVLYEVLTRAATLMRDAVERFAGAVTRCSGDRLVALFGAPLAQEDHAVRALQAALGVQRAVTVYTDELRHTRALELGVGVHTGPVVLGPLGPDARLDASVQGFTLYLAERLQALAAGGAIYVSAAVWQQAVGFFCFEDQGACLVPEIAQPVRVYACTGVAPVASRLEAFLHRHQSTFLGRERELDLLGTLWARACHGQGQVGVLFGEAGVGKSRLAYEFQRTLTEGRTLYAHTLSYGQAMPYHAMIPLLRTVLGLTEHDTPPQQCQAIRASLAAVLPSLAADAPLLARLLGVPPESESLPPLLPEEQKRRLQHACVQVLVQHAAQKPLCLLIEDLHWLDPSSQELLDLLVTAVAGHPVLVLGTARPGFRDPWTDHTYYHRLTVAPLSDALTEMFIHNYLQPYAATATLTGLIRARTAGNPFFLEEMLRTLQEQGRIVLQDDVYVLTPDAHLAMPSSVQGMLAARIDRLPAEAKGLLQTAAVLGRDVPIALLGAVAELPDAILHQGLRHLQAAEFLYETRLSSELACTFKHALTHEVAYGSLLQEQRRALHARIVETIEGLYADCLIDQVERLAHHALRGEVWARALAYGRQAGVRALARSAHREAVAYLEQALTALAQLPECQDTLEQAIDLRFDLRNALLPLGEQALTLEHLRAAEALAERLGDPHRLGQITARLCIPFLAVGEHQRAIAVGQRALALAASSGAFEARIVAQTQLGIASHLAGDFRQALDMTRRVLGLLTAEQRLARFDLLSPPAVISRNYMAWSLAELGHFTEGSAAVAELMQLAEAVAQPYIMASALIWGGGFYRRQGAFHTAIPMLEQGLALCQTARIAQFSPVAVSTLGATYAFVGRTAEALPLLNQMLEHIVTGSYTIYQGPVLAELSEAYLLVDHVDAARECANCLLDLSRTHTERGYQAHACRLLGDVAMSREPADVEKAAAHYHQALAVAEAIGMRPLLAHCHRGLGTLYAQMRQREQAHAELSTAMALYRALEMTFWLPQTEAALSQIGSVPRRVPS